MTAPVTLQSHARAWAGRPKARIEAVTTDPTGWHGRHLAALEAMRAGKPLSRTEVIGLCVGSSLVVGALGGYLEEGPDGSITANPAHRGGTTPERKAAGESLGESLGMILLYRAPASEKAPALPPKIRLLPSGDAEAAGWPPAVAILAIGAVVAFAVYQASVVAERWALAHEQTAQLEEKHAAAARIIANHVQREREEGKPLPLDDASKAALASLDKEAAIVAARVPPPRTVINVPGDLGSGALLGSTGTLVAVALLAFFFLKR